MKKLFTIVALALLALTVNAQDFQKNWYLQLQGGAAHTIGETQFNKLISPVGGINLGWNFAPAVSARLSIFGGQAKGSVLLPEENVYKIAYAQGTVDIMLHLATVFAGYDADRVFDPYVFLGGGGSFGFKNGAPRSDVTEYYWEGFTPIGLCAKGGAGVDFNLSKVVALGLEYNCTMHNDKLNSKNASNPDWQHSLALGLKFNFGKKAAPAPVVAEPVVYSQPEPAPVVEEKPAPAPAPAPRPAPKYQGTTENIFFLLDKDVIRPDEQVKIDEVVKAMKENPTTTIVVTGYADVETGTGKYNMALSKRRAQNVANAIIAAGIAADRVTVDAKGSEERPFSVQAMNRVAICVVSPAK